jgi:manganese transport system substrate-binding protein
MKKNILFSLLLLISLSLVSCKRISNKNESKEVILASFTVLADIISNVAKDDFIVRSITKPGV